MRTPPITPRPPAFVTAAASRGPAATFIPASKTGCLILRRSVTGVLICSRASQPSVRITTVASGLRGEAMIDLERMWMAVSRSRLESLADLMLRQCCSLDSFPI